jgi:hypothetical protein
MFSYFIPTFSKVTVLLLSYFYPTFLHMPARKPELVFLAKAKIRYFGALSALVKDSRQFKQREKRLLKVVIVNLPLYKQLYTILKSCISWCGDSQTCMGEAVLRNGGKIGREN